MTKLITLTTTQKLPPQESVRNGAAGKGSLQEEEEETEEDIKPPPPERVMKRGGSDPLEEAEEKRLKIYEDNDNSMVIDDAAVGSEDFEEAGSEDYLYNGGGGGGYSGEHIIVASDPLSSPAANLPGGAAEDLGPLHKRCPVCHMVMLKKNLSRHVRDQHTIERPRSICPVCQKTYKTQDWLKDHIRRGHGYSKEDTDELMAKIRLDGNMNQGDLVSAGPPKVMQPGEPLTA